MTTDTPTIQLSDEQQSAVEQAVSAVQSRRNFIIRGPAGTGKTTLIRALVQRLHGNGRGDYPTKGSRVEVVTPTGKASYVLKRKGISATTIHRLIYEQVSENPLTFAKRQRSEMVADVIIVDEASMVSQEVYDDLLSYGRPIVFIGDHAQLEPVGNDPKILSSFDFELTRVYRTAEENPVLGFATYLRQNPERAAVGYVMQHAMKSPDDDRLRCVKKSDVSQKPFLRSFDQVICGKNVTRRFMNQFMRMDASHPLPVPGDKVICLRNDYSHGVVNGEIFLVGPRGIIPGNEESEFEPRIELLNDDGNSLIVSFWQDYFFNFSLDLRTKPRKAVWLDFGWAITCHKSQGSEWSNVLVVDEAFGRPINRWRYTAATRSSSHLTWCI